MNLMNREKKSGTLDPDLDETPWESADLVMGGLLTVVFREGRGEPENSPDPESASVRYLPSFIQDEAFPPPGTIGREPAVGESLGRFRIEQEVGRGGFGVVYRGFDSRLGRTVAIKIPRPDRVQNYALWDRFAREARLAGSLNHEAIVPVLDAGVMDGVICIVSAFQEGETLATLIAERYASGMPPRLATDLATKIASGIDHAHRNGVVHRDLKPANVLMTIDAGSDRLSPKITDFGLGGVLADADGQTLTGFWQGSPPYMAPEQVLAGFGSVGARTDIYSFGAILYEMLTGRSIYESRSIFELSAAFREGEPPVRSRRLRRGIPRDLETIVLKCLERDPSRRYPAASVLLEELERFAAGLPILARPLSAPERVGRWIKRKPSMAALAALSIAGTAVTLGLVIHEEFRLSAKNAELTQTNQRLASTVLERDAGNAELKSSLDRLKASELETLRKAYDADISLAAGELAAGRVEMAQTLLRRQEPRPGGIDFRDFTWRYLMRRATREYSVHQFADLRWWRGRQPLAPILEAADLSLRDYVRQSFGDVELDPDGIRHTWKSWSSWGMSSRSIASYFVEFEPNGTPRLLAAAERRVVQPSGLGCHHAMSRDGRAIALDSEVSDDPRRPLPLKFHDGGAAPNPFDSHDSSLNRNVRLIEVPKSSLAVFSGDGKTLGRIAASSEEMWPVFHDVDSPWRASYPEYKVTPGADKRPLPRLLRLSYDGRLAALTDRRPTLLRVFETRTGRTLWMLGNDALDPVAEVSAAAFADDGSALVTGDSVGRTTAWDASTGRKLGECSARVGFVSSVGFHPNRSTVAIVSGYEIRLWDHTPRPDPPEVIDHGDEVWGLTFTRGGKTLVSVGDDHYARAWDVATGKAGRSYRSPNLLTAVTAMGTAPNDSVTFVGFSGHVWLYDGNLARKSVLYSTRDLEPRWRAAAYAPDGKTLVVGGKSPKLLITEWKAGFPPKPRLIELPHQDAYALAFSSDGKTLAIGSHDQVITLWDATTFEHRETLKPFGKVACLAYSPDGTTLASGDDEGRLQLWDTATNTSRVEVNKASELGGVWSVSFSPDGKTLATGGDDGMVRLWDPVFALHRLALVGHRAKVHAVAFSPKGDVLASGDFEGKIRLWRASR